MVSIIIPTFNEEKNIERLLISIKKQTYKNIETIIVDDDSFDKTVDIARRYIRRVYRRKHSERSIQRNFGAKRASGEYLLFLDADMELTPEVVKSCVENINGYKALIIPEKTVGKRFMARIRSFEREMYMGDSSVEVARFFEKSVFTDFGGYDVNLTGTEDYDLPYRISKKYPIGWAKEWILHHEEDLTLANQLKKKFYYASKSALYVRKHPELIKTQGNMLFRRAYIRHWKKFLQKPNTAIAFLFVKVLEQTAAVLGFISAILLKK